jgi:hypothetical protein
MKIVDGNTKFVLNCTAQMIDQITDNMNYTMSGNGQVMVSWEEIISWVEEGPCTGDRKELYELLREVEQAITGEVGDVIFCA